MPSLICAWGVDQWVELQEGRILMGHLVIGDQELHHVVRLTGGGESSVFIETNRRLGRSMESEIR